MATKHRTVALLKATARFAGWPALWDLLGGLVAADRDEIDDAVERLLERRREFTDADDEDADSAANRATSRHGRKAGTVLEPHDSGGRDYRSTASMGIVLPKDES